MRGDRMPECVATHVLHNPRLADGLLDGPLENRLVNMMPSFFVSPGVLPAAFLGKDPLPAPVLRRVGVLAVEGVWKLHTAPPIRDILLMNGLDLFEVVLERDLRRFGQHRDPVFRPLAVANQNLIPGEIDVLHSQAQAFHQSKARAIHE